MKKVLLALLMLIPIKCFGATDYFNLQHYEVDPDTITVGNDLRIRGSIRLYNDKSTFLLADSTPTVTISSLGVITGASVSTVTGSTFTVKVNSVDTDFEVTSASITIYDDLYSSNSITNILNMGEDSDIWQIIHSSAGGTAATPLIFIDDNRVGTTADEASEATLYIDTEGAYAIYVQDGQSYFGQSIHIVDARGVMFGTDKDYNIGYSAARDAVVFGDGANTDSIPLWATDASSTTFFNDLNANGNVYFKAYINLDTGQRLEFGDTANDNRIIESPEGTINISLGGNSELAVHADTTTIRNLLEVKSDGTNKDFSIDSSSATFYDNVYFDQGVQLAANMTVVAANIQMYDDVELFFGTSGPNGGWSLAQYGASDIFRCVYGSDVSTTSVVWWTDISGYLSIGSSGTIDNADRYGDLYVKYELEVDSTTHLNGDLYVGVNKLATTYDYSVTISSPFALGTVATLISPFRDFDNTISSITAQCIGGTNVVLMIEQRTVAGVSSAGTDIWTGDITATTAGWIGGTASDFTMGSGRALVLVPTSVSGDVDRLMIKYTITVD